MVKVHEEEARMAEPRGVAAPGGAAAAGGASASARHHKASRHHHHHVYHPALPQFPHFHHHWSYPDATAAACPAAGPATFHFGPGFELQQPLASRYASGAGPSQSAPVVSPTTNGSEHVVHFHVNPGVTVSFQIGDNMELIRGPVTVPMVSTNSSPPIAMPVQVPPGHVVQQIVDESGTLRHVILSPQPPPLHMSHNPQHYGTGPGNGSTQPTQSFYSQGLPPGYSSPHFHSNMASGHLGHVQSNNNLGHSPPPSYSYHKDERTQRQYNKLKRKLEQKRSDGFNPGHNASLLSPRKDLVNGLRRGAAKERGMNSVGTSEDGEENSSVQDDEDEVNVIIDILSSVQSPQVSDLSSRSALLQWSVPSRLAAGTNSNEELDISESDLKYDVLLSDKGKEGKYKSIYSGASLSCWIQDLKPGQEYSVCLQVHFDELQGSASDPITFTTPACEPDKPLSPKLISRTKTSLQLRWNATTDNGSHILQYILEYDEGKGGGFVELSKCRGKQYNLTKLQPSTMYKFRLAAVNECGKSVYSDIISFSTSGSPPSQPNAPLLKEATINSLGLVWNRRPTDDDFTLQMNNVLTGYGYMNAYVGKDTEYVVPNLTRYTDYKFRLRAHNEESTSSWSEEVCYRTLPDRPAQPARPTVRGKIHAHSFKLKWEPPHDKGGADINTYILELSSGSNFETVYRGSETEAVCDKLAPGTTYQLRVSCISAGGRSNFSDPCTVTTEAICPGKCSNLKMHGKPRATSVNLKWSEPDYNGGAPVTEYELNQLNSDLTDPDQQTVYKGKEAECVISNLLPGNEYSFVVRAINRVGGGPWSDVLCVTSGAAAPETPQAPATLPKSPFNIIVEWPKPHCNGAPVTEYKLEMSHIDQEDMYTSVYQGISTSYDVKGLTPFTTYFFRVQACNSAGCSLFSQVSATLTPAATPSVMSIPRYEATYAAITLFWTEPACNGSDISHYIIEVSDKLITTDGPCTEYVIESLKPETVYKIKIKAVNAVGSGAFSPVLRASTLPLPPPPPKLDCIGVGHNYLKLKWGDGKNLDFTQYSLEMENNRSKEFQCIYQGTNYSYKVNKLHELTNYRFRISAMNDTGHGDFSDEYIFKTSIAPPTGLKAIKVIEVSQRTCSLEWTPCKMLNSDPVEYCVQQSRNRDQEYKLVYRGPEVKLTLVDLDPGVEYNVRVCPVRVTSSGDLQGVYSPPTCFQTCAAETFVSTKHSTPLVTMSPAHARKNQSLLSWLTFTQHSDKKPMSDSQWAIVIILGFTVFAIFAAVIVEQLFINWRKTV